MRALNVNDFIFDLDRIKAVVNSEPKTVSLIEKLQYMINEYEKQHSFEAEPVRHGQWRYDGAWRNEDGIVNDYFCSCCGRIISIDCRAELENYPYCHCGAKMNSKE